MHRLFVVLTSIGKLIKSEYNVNQKTIILLIYLKVLFRYLFVSRLFKIQNERFLGFKVSAYNYNSIYTLFQEVFVTGEYYFKCVSKKPTIFDCGANVGFATLFFKWLYPDSTIYAFEAAPDSFEMLKKNVNTNKLENVFIHHAAIYDSNGTIDFFIENTAPGAFIASTVQARFPKNKIAVPSVKLSDFLHKISIVDFLKMDVEGAETCVIADLSKNNLLKKCQEIILEYHHNINPADESFSAFLKHFESAGFHYLLQTSSVSKGKHKYQDIVLYFYR